MSWTFQDVPCCSCRASFFGLSTHSLPYAPTVHFAFLSDIYRTDILYITQVSFISSLLWSLSGGRTSNWEHWILHWQVRLCMIMRDMDFLKFLMSLKCDNKYTVTSEFLLNENNYNEDNIGVICINIHCTNCSINY